MWPIEGTPASRNPHASLTADPGGLRVAAAADLILGRFAWADRSGEVSNAFSEGARLAFVAAYGLALPAYARWDKVYRSCGRWYLRSGNGVTLYSCGDFWTRFEGGGVAGRAVYASQADGSASVAGGDGYQLTSWTLVDTVGLSDLGRITTFSKPFN